MGGEHPRPDHRLDAVLHNAAVGYQERQRVEAEDDLAQVFAVNVLAPYLLTALMAPPSRHMYFSSGMHRGGDPSLDDLAQGPVTQVWLAVSGDAEARTSGGHWYHRARRATHPAVSDGAVQEGLLTACAELSGVPLP